MVILKDDDNNNNGNSTFLKLFLRFLQAVTTFKSKSKIYYLIMLNSALHLHLFICMCLYLKVMVTKGIELNDEIFSNIIKRSNRSLINSFSK